MRGPVGVPSGWEEIAAACATWTSGFSDIRHVAGRLRTKAAWYADDEEETHDWTLSPEDVA